MIFFILDLEGVLTQQALIEVTLTFFVLQDWYTSLNTQRSLLGYKGQKITYLHKIVWSSWNQFHVLRWKKGPPNFCTMAKKNGHCVELKWFWLYAWPIFSLLLPAQVIIYESYSFFRHFNEILHKITIFYYIFPLFL